MFSYFFLKKYTAGTEGPFWGAFDNPKDMFDGVCFFLFFFFKISALFYFTW